MAVKKKYEHNKYMKVAVALENPSVLYVEENDASLNEGEYIIQGFNLVSYFMGVID